MEKILIYKGGVLIKDILRSDKRPSDISLEDVATAIMGRDYKGLSNYANGVVEIWKITE